MQNRNAWVNLLGGLLFLVGMIPAGAFAQTTQPPTLFQVPANAPPPVIQCIKSVNSVYLQRVNDINSYGNSIAQDNNPSKFECLGNLMKGMMIGFPTLNLSQILSEIENLACSALTSVVNAQMSAFGSTIELPGGLGNVSVLPSYNSGVTGNASNISTEVGTSIWDSGPGQNTFEPPIKNPLLPGIG